MRPGGLGTRRSSDNAVIVLPQPDSPTIANVSDAAYRERDVIDGLDDPAAREQVGPQSLDFDNVLGIVAGRPQPGIGRRSRFGRYRQVIPLVC